ncbi:MAG: hypothetical protein WKG01_39540 [Kofleriaceae bacterium]
MRGDAYASPTTVTAEAGAEGDTNVQRVETGPSSEARVGAPAARVGAKVDHRGAIWRGGYALQLSTLARLVADSETRSENVALLAGDLRWLRAIGSRPVSAGAGITAADAISLTSETGARTFTNLGADALLVLRGSETRVLTFAAGVRRFTYKPDHGYDWIGPAASARIDLTLWEPAGGRGASSSRRCSGSRRAHTTAPRSRAHARAMRRRIRTALPAPPCPAAIAITAPASS